jgi:hypothetical protein
MSTIRFGSDIWTGGTEAGKALLARLQKLLHVQCSFRVNGVVVYYSYEYVVLHACCS